VAHTQHTLTGVEAIVQTLREARQRGYAINREELFLGDIWPPRCWRQRTAAGRHPRGGPTSRWTLEEAERRLAPPLLQCARAVTSSVRTMG
jgi:DNA-binding IclR family transcriptional regulator